MRLEEDLVIRRSRPTMISAKYRAREERRRLMKISAVKLKRIEDPEASLCRSVLINNALRRLHRESRDDKTRSYGTLPVMASYMDDVSKENSVAGNLIADVTDEEASSRKRYASAFIYYIQGVYSNLVKGFPENFLNFQVFSFQVK